MNSLSQWAEVTRSAFPAQQSHHDPFNDFLGIIDIDFLAACEYTNFRIHGTNVGMRIPPADGHALGQGGTYFVRRVAYDSSLHRIAALGELWKDPKPSFAVLKQESIDDNDSIVNIKDIDHMRSAMLEMRILRHAPVHEHPNIIGLYQMRWDVHDDFRLVSPSVVMEYGHFGTLADFQDHEFLSLNWSSKKGLCLDVAQGLQFLHECGIIHGDIKTEYARSPNAASPPALICQECFNLQASPRGLYRKVIRLW
ncbi:hypothetical protein CC78DRAFT_314456 [Lojkania enalia]|uniref:Protein kinase domain-containing protein n=1 Tax=Lojkania enalia TaxID=147567 RepID=A0A9P4K7Y6_9PLEO|nr:hypothetical protein CC78DRAFT_314456 [Didymosphaeria enalia]